MLDERYGCAYHIVALVSGETPSSGPMDVAQHTFSGPLPFASRSWSLTASYSTGPEIRNRWRAVAPEDFATPGTDRVRHGDATPGMQIPLERQYGDLTLASAQYDSTACDIVAPQFPMIEALRAEYQNPLMEEV